MLRVQRGEVLCKAFAQPLFVVVAPADRLSPPLVRDLMRREEIVVTAERRRIVSPDQRRRRQRLIERRKVTGAVSARKIAFDERHCERRIRHVADDRLIELRDVRRALGQLTTALHLPGIRLDRKIQARIRRSTQRNGVPFFALRKRNRRRLRAREAAHDEREIPHRLHGVEQIHFATLRRILRSRQHRVAGLKLAAGDAIERAWHRQTDRRCRVVGDRRLRIPEASAAVQEAGLGRHQRDVLAAARRLLERDRLAIRRLRLEPAGVRDRQPHCRVASERGRHVHDERVLVLHANAEEPSVLVADDRLHAQRVGEPDGQRAEHRRPHFEVHAHAPVDPVPHGRDRGVHVVVEDVVVDEVVFVVEPAARRELLLRGVDRNVVVPLAIEERDVFSFARRFGVRQRVVLARVQLDAAAIASSKFTGLIRMNAAVNGVSSDSLPQKIRTWPFSVLDGG